MHLNCVAHGTLNLKQIITRSVTMHSKIPLCCVPSDTEISESESVTVSKCPLSCNLVWRLEIVNQHTQFGCQEISGAEDM